MISQFTGWLNCLMNRWLAVMLVLRLKSCWQITIHMKLIAGMHTDKAVFSTELEATLKANKRRKV